MDSSLDHQYSLYVDDGKTTTIEAKSLTTGYFERKPHLRVMQHVIH